MFTAPSFRPFTALACGFLAQSGKRTVCGMLIGAACRGCGAMTAKLRRVIIAAKFKPLRPDQPKPEEIHAIRLAWEDAEDLTA